MQCIPFSNFNAIIMFSSEESLIEGLEINISFDREKKKLSSKEPIPKFMLKRIILSIYYKDRNLESIGDMYVQLKEI